jgi:RNA polymerase sigma-70 factor (ECF subfamily)
MYSLGMSSLAWPVLLAAANDDVPSPRVVRLEGAHSDVPPVHANASLDDQRLIRAIRNGETEALRELYLATYRSLVGFATALIRSQAEAEEIVQDVFAAVWVRRTEWTPTTTVAAYLFAAVRNRASHIRAHAVVTDNAERDRESVMSRAMGQAPEPPDRAVESDEIRRAVDHAVAQLPERRRLALGLRYREGMSYAEIGDVLGVSEHAATQLVHRARAAILSVLAPFREL